MHEVSLAANILQIVDDAARRDPFARVVRLHLEAGSLSGVDVSALRFALQCIAHGTLLEQAEIVIDEPAGQAWCMECNQRVTVAAHGDACPLCGGWQLMEQSGNALRVVHLDVVDRAD